jgi:hypothetical protein
MDPTVRSRLNTTAVVEATGFEGVQTHPVGQDGPGFFKELRYAVVAGPGARIVARDEAETEPPPPPDSMIGVEVVGAAGQAAVVAVASEP